MVMANLPKFVDIGVNLGDPTFRGKPRSKQIHPDDLIHVLDRAKRANVVAQVVTGDCLAESRKVAAYYSEYSGYNLYSTAGCHPCRANEAVAYPGGIPAYVQALSDLIRDKSIQKGGSIVAVGEIGLDYDRLFLSGKEDQLAVFPPQLELASQHDLPLFLHCRTSEAHKDFVDIIKKHRKPLRGVVHSHTGSIEEALELIEMGFYIGVNGCSLKTEENLAVVKRLPLSSLLLETDAPWCDIRKSHASHKHLASLSISEIYKEAYMVNSKKPEQHSTDMMVKGRNEPCTIGQVAWVISQLQDVPFDQVAESTTRNARDLFGIS